MSLNSPALFLDRDGVVVTEVNGAAPKRPDEVRLLPEMIAVLRELAQREILLVLASNQPDYALGQISLADRAEIERTFLALIAEAGIRFADCFYCYHHPKGIIPDLSGQCLCRKPEPGLLLRAQRELRVDLSRSYFVGDRASDIKAGKLAGVTTILFDRRDTQGPFLLEHQIRPDFIIRDPQELLTIIPATTQ